jgi:hypothetical protein
MCYFVNSHADQNDNLELIFKIMLSKNINTFNKM